MSYLRDNVEFPDCLPGGIKNRESPRDYLTNASLHAGQSKILRVDIKDFFPSITESHVLGVWRHFFNSPEEVALILTQLTTYRGYVPSGAPTSTYVANLIFWDWEPLLEYELRQNGYIYTRYIDDITISTHRKMKSCEMEPVVAKLVSMLGIAGFKINRRKIEIQDRSSEQTVHNRNIQSGKPTLPEARGQTLELL